MKTNLIESITLEGPDLDLTIPQIDIYPHQTELFKQPLPMFLPCKHVRTTESRMTFTYSLGRYQSLALQMDTYTKVEKYLILLQIGQYFDTDHEEYATTFDPQNIVLSSTYEISFLLRLFREVPGLERSKQDEFNDYKSLVLSAIQSKYRYDQLVQFGHDVLDKDAFCSGIIDCQTPEALETLLRTEYDKNLQNARKNRMAFSAGTVKTLAMAVTVLMAALISTLAYFIYDNVSQTRTYGKKMYIYESYYNRDPLAVIEYAKKIKDADMSPSLKKVVADALIATNDPANLERAFALDPTRHLEILDKLILLQDYDRIAPLSSDNRLAQLTIAHYAKDYPRAIELYNNSPDLKNSAQAQLLIAQTYAALGDYTSAETILRTLGDFDALIDMYKQHREDVLKNEADPERRQQKVAAIDEIMKLIEEVRKNQKSE
jgi:uncharacterized membrane protein YukC